MKFVSSFTDFLIGKDIISEDKKEIYEYGFNQLIVYIYNFASFIIIGLIMGMFWQSIAFTVFYMLIRPYAGGYHARTPKMCYIYSLFMIFAVLLWMKVVPLNGLFYVIIYIISSLIILKLSPVEDENKPLDNIEKIVFRKRAINAYIILSILYFVLWFAGLMELAVCIVLALFVLSIMLILGYFKNRYLKREAI